MTSHLFSRRTLVAGSAAGVLLTAAGGSGARAASGAPALPPLDPRTLREAISDLDHPPSTSAQLRVCGTAGHWHGSEG
ncbi:MAG TPA: peptidase, partial [Streptomyces sp.]|nr:peptidase [Streptomyces sp.]